MLKNALLVLSLVTVALARLRHCDRGHVGPFPIEHRITGCPNPNEVCRLVRGRDVTGYIDFIAMNNAVALRPEIIAYAFGVRAIYDLPADRQIGCDWISGTRCPLTSGEFATYEINMPVTEEYPLTTLEIEIRLYDQDDHIHFCTIIESEVVLN